MIDRRDFFYTHVETNHGWHMDGTTGRVKPRKHPRASLPEWWCLFLKECQVRCDETAADIEGRCLQLHATGILSTDNDRVGCIYNQFMERQYPVGNHN